MDVQHDCILSKNGDVTIVFRAELPEIFTLSDQEYEAFHQTWIKAIKILPKHTVLHKQDWFLDSTFSPDFSGPDNSFLSGSSDRFFNERPFLDHSCYIMLTKSPRTGKAQARFFQPAKKEYRTGGDPVQTGPAGLRRQLGAIPPHHGRQRFCQTAKNDGLFPEKPQADQRAY